MKRPCPDCKDGRHPDGEKCRYCCGTGQDPEGCDRCSEEGIGFDDDGTFLCEDCLFEQMMEDTP